MRAINRRRSLVGVLLLGVALSAAAHREPGSLTTIKWNASSGKTEIVHRLHSHDAELGVGQVLGIADLSVLNLEGRAIIALYVEARFRITAGEEDIQLDLIGAELAGDYVLVYQEHSAELPAQIHVHDSTLRDVYPAQINQVNIEDGDTVHSLVFTADDDWLSYEFTQVQTTQRLKTEP
jgi:hypothetical protein